MYCCGHLREGRLLALAVGRDAGEDRDIAARLDPDRRALVRPEAAYLDIGRDADAEVAALLARGFLLFAKAGVVGDFECLVERLLVLAGVVVLAGQRRVRELLGPEEVDCGAPQPDRARPRPRPGPTTRSR